jgi:hypothetical protein
MGLWTGSLERAKGKALWSTFLSHTSGVWAGIPGTQVTGKDGSGNSFQQTTDSRGEVAITGDPGTWYFTASADGYVTKSWNQEITDTCTKHPFLQ